MHDIVIDTVYMAGGMFHAHGTIDGCNAKVSTWVNCQNNGDYPCYWDCHKTVDGEGVIGAYGGVLLIDAVLIVSSQDQYRGDDIQFVPPEYEPFCDAIQMHWRGVV